MATYRANLDSSVILKSEKDLSFIWIRYKKRVHLPRTQEYRDDYVLQAYPPDIWRDMIKQNSKAGLDFPRSAGFDSFEIVHDPSLTKDINDLKTK